ncbi:protein GVQW3-like [Hydra vulgaris]|uniref:protein GVQW3-like n=1 Tax=Hydra vulgaris TaxID=6087 RepID=UPI001F5F231F|nr:protein GVQW3-like [Hydra vulgaris]
MEKTEIRAVIKYQYLKGLKPQEIINNFNKTLGSSAPSKTTVYDWYNEFKHGRSSTSDAERSGRPKEVSTEEMIEKIHDIVIENGKIKVREIANRVNISYEHVFNILHRHLEMKKLAAR